MLDINKIRNDFPALHQLIYKKPLVYFDNAATTQKPQCVIDTLTNYYAKQNSNIHRGVHYLSQQATTAYENARLTVQKFINTSALKMKSIKEYRRLLMPVHSSMAPL